MSLTDKQARFVSAYVLDPNGKKAAIAAGYAEGSAEVTASKLLRLAKVQEAIKSHTAATSVRAGITADMVIAELARLGFADIRQVIEWHSIGRQLFDGNGEPADVPAVSINIKDSADIDSAAGAAIAEVSQSKDGTIKVKMHDKLGALVKIGQHLGMFRPVAAPDEPGKKDQADISAKTAEKGTGWDGLLQ